MGSGQGVGASSERLGSPEKGSVEEMVGVG
jgi:hypothetical protein